MQLKEDKFLGFRSPLDLSKSRIRHAFDHVLDQSKEDSQIVVRQWLSQSKIKIQKSISDMF